MNRAKRVSRKTRCAILVRTPDGLWFAGGRIPDGRVGRYNADWSYDRTIVGFPPEAVETPGVPFRQIYESWVVADPAGGRLAAATLLAGLLEIFDYDGVLLARAAVPSCPTNQASENVTAVIMATARTFGVASRPSSLATGASRIC